MDDYFKFVALDGDLVPRVYGTGDTADIAESRCREFLLTRAKARPDWRLDEFTIIQVPAE